MICLRLLSDWQLSEQNMTLILREVCVTLGSDKAKLYSTLYAYIDL